MPKQRLGTIKKEERLSVGVKALFLLTVASKPRPINVSNS